MSDQGAIEDTKRAYWPQNFKNLCSLL